MLFYKLLEKLNQVIFSEKRGRNYHIQGLKNYSNNLISKLIEDKEPILISRFGAFELNVLKNVKSIKINKKHNPISYLMGSDSKWWFNENLLKKFHFNAGFFPIKNRENIFKYYDLCMSDIQEINLLGSWLHEEYEFREMLRFAKRVLIEDLEPFFSENPWTLSLKNKKVLIIHPFSEDIQYQYEKRNLLFENQILPEMDLKVYKPIELNEAKKIFQSWFDALEFMKKEIKEIDFDVAIIGAGAYGMNLGAEIKRWNKKAIHLGGATQLLFGIKGRRWIDYPIQNYPTYNLFNEHWIRPSNKPTNYKEIEGGCYW